MEELAYGESEYDQSALDAFFKRLRDEGCILSAEQDKAVRQSALIMIQTAIDDFY